VEFSGGSVWNLQEHLCGLFMRVCVDFSGGSVWTFQEDLCGLFRRVCVDFSGGSVWTFYQGTVLNRWNVPEVLCEQACI
jgi:hypothetical protein